MALLIGGWLCFDGVRALTVGDYVTPSSGPHTGQLGPWSGVLISLGIEPRSTAVKILHILSGSLWLVSGIALIAGKVWAPTLVITAGVLSLWYLPFGTTMGVVACVLATIMIRRSGR
ncbi:MAG: hypothetical protein ACREJO_12295 [Phycisphaerales bacterium]